MLAEPHTWSVSDCTCPVEYTHIQTYIERSKLFKTACVKETNLFGDLATVVKVVQHEDPFLLSVLVKHYVTLCDLHK